MGRIVTWVMIQSFSDQSKSLRYDALVDTGVCYLTLPSAWKEQLGTWEQIRTVEVQTATQEIIEGSICGPVRIELEGFPPTFGEVLFVEMTP
jgi:predicted aspartyl protease